MYSPVLPRSSCIARRRLPTAATDRTFSPGATTSGFRNPSYHVGPRELNAETRSSSREIVSNMFVDPLVIAEGALPGDAMPAYPGSPVFLLMPKLPADTLTINPWRTAFSTACTNGSVAADS
jgi:hypothetical protein